MLEELLLKGKISYVEKISKIGDISKDILKIEYINKTHYILCTFKGIKLTNIMLIS